MRQKSKKVEKMLQNPLTNGAKDGIIYCIVGKPMPIFVCKYENGTQKGLFKPLKQAFDGNLNKVRFCVMKKFNRVLAMVLALITVLAMLPISAIADTWLDVDAEKEQTGNVTSTDITVTVDPHALLSYLQDGDWVGLLQGMSATGGLESIMTPDEFFAIVPKEELVKLVEMILEDIDTAELKACIDVNELLTCFDKAALIDLFMGLDNLQSYVRDFDALISYVDAEDIEAAIAFIDTDALIVDYAEELIDLALGLELETLFDIVDLDKAVTLADFDFAAAADQDFFVNTVAKTDDLASYVDLEAIKAILETLDYEDVKVYINEANAQAILQNKLKDVQALWYPSANRDKYWLDVGHELNLENVYADRNDLLPGTEAFMLYGYTDGETTYAPAFNLSVILFGDKENGIEPLFDLAELINNNYVNVEKLAQTYGYDELVVIEEVKNQIADGTVSAADIVACIDDYSKAIEVIGVAAAIEAIGSYEFVINNYVGNINALVGSFDLVAIADQIISERQINNVFRVVDMVYAVGIKKIAAQVELKKLGRLIYDSEVIGTFIGMLDVKEYLVQAFNILAGVQKNVTAIEIDGVVITEQNADGYIQLVPARVIDALENLVPSLGELASIDESGKIFNASFAISYYADETGEVVNTKIINFNFVLTAGADMIRKAAAKLAVVLDKIGYADLTGGELVAEITIPSEFATVLRVALEKLADSSDPKMNAIKDKVLAAYNANPDDFIAFAQGLTFEEVMAVLDAIDPALFGKVYNKALASRYAQVLLAYVEERTGYDLSDNLEVQYFVTAISEIPTFRDFVLTLEQITDIEILHLLPETVNGYLDHDAYEVIEKLGEVFGYEFDISNLLKAAAASTDPFGYLYTAVINKVENFGGAYAFVQRNAIKVANRLMATRVGATIADNCLMDFYAGNSTFVFDKDFTIDAKQLLKAMLCRTVNVLDDYKPGLASKLEFYVGELIDVLVSDNSSAHTGFDITVHVNNIYRVDFVNEYGAPITSLLLPVGTDLSKMVDNYANVEAFNGWVDVATGEFITVVPGKDVVVQADVQGVGTHTVTIVLVDSEGNTLPGTATIDVQDGSTLGAYIANLDALATGLYPSLTATEAFFGYAYTHAWNNAEWPATVEEDITIAATVALDITDGNIQIGGLTNGVEYTLELTDDACVITLNDNWNDYNGLDFDFDKALVATLANGGLDLVLTTAAENAQKVTLNNDVLAQLVAKASAHPTAVETIGFSYSEAVAAYAKAEAYEVGFNFNGVEDINLGDFTTAVEIVLPFAGVNTDDAKTFVYVNADECDVTVANGTVTFNAPHFSTITLVNKYAFKFDGKDYAVEGFAGQLPTAVEDLASFKQNGADAKFNAWYAEGEKIVGNFEANENAVAGLEYAYAKFNNTVVNGNEAFEFVMPAEAVTLTLYATTRTFYVYYYVNGALKNDLTVSYTILNVPTVESLTTPYDKNATDYYWYNQNEIASRLGKEDISLYWVNNSQTKITVNFIVDGKTVETLEKSIADWRDGGLANLKNDIDALNPGYIWQDNSGNKITDYTLQMLVQSLGNVVNFYGTPDANEYHVFTDGNATVDKTDVLAGTTVTITVTNKNGYTADVKVYKTESGITLGDEVAVTDGKFVMPSANVIVKVTYKAIEVAYEYIEIVVPANKAINATDITTLDAAPADLVLVKANRNENGDLVLTYRYSGSMNKNAFMKQVNALIAASQYLTTTYIVDGVAYTTEKEALANLPEGATFAGWIEMSKNVKVAYLEYAETESNTAWLVVCVVLALLLILAVITLIYVLHVSDRMGTSWITKVCTAIVTGFFAFCMFVAKIVTKLLILVGIKHEDILEELPADPAEDVPAVLINNPEEVAAEETTEETTEEN